MKIGLCGAGGTGKGTLVREIAKQSLVRYACGDEMISLTPLFSPIQRIGQYISPDSKSYMDILKNPLVRSEYQFAIAAAQIQQEIAHAKFDTISERSLFDFMAFGDGVSAGSRANYFEMLWNAYKEYPYDIVFFLPADDFTPEDDGNAAWKERNAKERRRSDAIMKMILTDKRIKENTLVKELRGSVRYRTEIALKTIIDQFKKGAAKNEV